jgi:cobaltochelatase CobS
MKDISRLIDQIDKEIVGEKETIISKLINQKLEKFVFDEKNISPNLINLLMTKKDVKVPIPAKGKPIPDIQSRAKGIYNMIDANIAGIFTDLQVGNNVYLYGKAGTGKTYLAKQIAGELFGRRTVTINCNQFTSPIEIRGGQTIEGYKQGALIEAWKNGWILILDELPKLDPNTAGLLNEALAETAGEMETEELTKEMYEHWEKILADAEDSELGFDLIEKDGEYFRVKYPTITDGNGDKIRKSEGFAVIATGNTNMKEISSNFSGNNRQDYSLVDRFAGSFYEIKYPAIEKDIIYPQVYRVSTIIREVLDRDESSVESVSLRTMLNFNRIYEQEYLRKIRSTYAKPVIEVGGKKWAKTFVESIKSFVMTLPPAKQDDIYKNTDAMSLAADPLDTSEFEQQFIKIHGVSPTE